MNSEYEILFQKVEEKKKRVSAARGKRDFLKSVFNNSVDIYWQHDMKGNYTEVLGDVEALYGYTREELLSMSAIDLLDEKEIPRMEKMFVEVITGKKSSFFELVVQNKDKTKLTVEVRAWPFLKNGKIQGICGITRDISERKNIENKLKEQRKKYQRIAENTNDLIWIWNIEKREHDYISPSLVNLTGYTVEENPLRTIKKNIVREDRQKLAEIFLSTPDDYGNGIGKGKYPDTKRVEWREYSKDGRIFWVEAVFSVIRNGQGKAVQMLGVSRDITPLKELEDELKHRNIFIETILDNLPLSITVHRISDGFSIYHNDMYGVIMGWKRGELPTVEEFFKKCFPDPVERKRVEDQMSKDFSSGDPSRMRWNNLDIQTRTGDKRTINIHNIPLFDQDLMISVAQDVTKMKTLEERLRYARKMESIATLAGGIAHQFNNALSVINGYLGIMKLETSNESFIHNYVTPMEISARRMGTLTEQLLAYARGGKFQLGKISMSELTQNMVSMFKKTLDPSVSLETDLCPQGVNVEVDATQIQLVISAILTNAIEAAEKEGRIVVTCKEEHIMEETAKDFTSVEKGRYVCLTVIDNGMGMDEHARSRMFEPFFTTKGHGRGLGMAAVYGIIKNHGGWVDVQSQTGKGTTVRVYLPAV